MMPSSTDAGRPHNRTTTEEDRNRGTTHSSWGSPIGNLTQGKAGARGESPDADAVEDPWHSPRAERVPAVGGNRGEAGNPSLWVISREQPIEFPHVALNSNYVLQQRKNKQVSLDWIRDGMKAAPTLVVGGWSSSKLETSHIPTFHIIGNPSSE